MSDDVIRMGVLHPDGSMTDEVMLSKDSIRGCKHYIIDPSHYNENGSCKCSDPNAPNMKEWGYIWVDGEWT